MGSARDPRAVTARACHRHAGKRGPTDRVAVDLAIMSGAVFAGECDG